MQGTTFLKTQDKSIALSLLEHSLDSPDVLNARVQKDDGMYSVEISRPEVGPGADTQGG